MSVYSDYYYVCTQCVHVHGANIVWVRVNVHTILSSLSTWPAKAIALWFNALTQLWVYTHANTCTSECVCYHASCYSPRLYVENIKALLSFLCHLVHVYCVNFIENTLFRNYGNICWPPLPSLLLDGLLKDKKRQWCLCFNMTIVCRSVTSPISWLAHHWTWKMPATLLYLNCAELAASTSVNTQSWSVTITWLSVMSFKY